MIAGEETTGAREVSKKRRPPRAYHPNEKPTERERRKRRDDAKWNCQVIEALSQYFASLEAEHGVTLDIKPLWLADGGSRVRLNFWRANKIVGSMFLRVLIKPDVKVLEATPALTKVLNGLR